MVSIATLFLSLAPPLSFLFHLDIHFSTLKTRAFITRFTLVLPSPTTTSPHQSHRRSSHIPQPTLTSTLLSSRRLQTFLGSVFQASILALLFSASCLKLHRTYPTAPVTCYFSSAATVPDALASLPVVPGLHLR